MARRHFVRLSPRARTRVVTSSCWSSTTVMGAPWLSGFALSRAERSARQQLLAAALHRGAEPHRLAIFGDRATRDVEATFAQQIDQRVVGEDRVRPLLGDQLADMALHSLCRGGLAAVGRLDCAGEEIFELIEPAVTG